MWLQSIKLLCCIRWLLYSESKIQDCKGSDTLRPGPPNQAPVAVDLIVLCISFMASTFQIKSSRSTFNESESLIKVFVDPVRLPVSICER